MAQITIEEVKMRGFAEIPNTDQATEMLNMLVDAVDVAVSSPDVRSVLSRGIIRSKHR